jgi:hypothetical protein
VGAPEVEDEAAGGEGVVLAPGFGLWAPAFGRENGCAVLAGGSMSERGTSLSPLLGLVSISFSNPRFTPWAAFLRRFAAEL